MRPVSRVSPPRAQRGAAAVFAAVSLVTLLSAVALAIDVGRLYYANRDLQRLADLAAMDGARIHSQCLGAAGVDEVQAEILASLARNRVPEGVTPVMRLGLKRSGDNGLQFFQAATAENPAADSVQVTLSRSSPARILPLFAGDDSRTLTTRAAAQAQWVASASISAPRGASGSGQFQSAFVDRVLGGNSGTGGGFGSSGASDSASVSIAGVINANVEVTTDVPDVLTPTPVPGLLTQIAVRLDQTGDTAAAAVVSSYATAVATARPGSSVIPAEVFGLPAQGAYDGATSTVGDVLGAIAGAVSEGDAIALGGICDLINLDDLPTAELLPAFCDSTATVRVPQPGSTGVFNSSSETSNNTTTNTSSNTASSSGGVVEVRLGIVNPLNGQPVNLPLLAVAEPSQARVTELACARIGQALNTASVTANGPRVTFAIGGSEGFAQAFSPSGGEPDAALDDLTPVAVISASVQQVLASAGLGGALLSNPLNTPFLNQPVTISVRAGPVVVGSSGPESFCMQGPPYGIAEQCNGAAATVGGSTAQEAAEQIASGLGDVEITVDTPQGLPLGLSTALGSATTTLSETLAARLAPAVTEASKHMVPILQSANLVVGESSVYLNSATAIQPRVYAQ